MSPAELWAIFRQRIDNAGDYDQSIMAMAELGQQFKEWLKGHDGHYKNFEEAWRAFSGKDWKQ